MNEHFSTSKELVAQRALCQCPECADNLVQEVKGSRHRAGAGSWTTVLECPNCEHQALTFCTEGELKKFDEEHLLGRAMMELVEHMYDKQAKREDMMHMAKEIGVFAGALRAGHILPEDF